MGVQAVADSLDPLGGVGIEEHMDDAALAGALTFEVEGFKASGNVHLVINGGDGVAAIGGLPFAPESAFDANIFNRY